MAVIRTKFDLLQFSYRCWSSFKTVLDGLHFKTKQLVDHFCDSPKRSPDGYFPVINKSVTPALLSSDLHSRLHASFLTEMGFCLVLMISVTDLFHCISFTTANSKIFFPAPWLDGPDVEQHPVNIWYWVREQSFTGLPRSCAEIQLRATDNKPVTGIMIIFKAKFWFAWVTVH